MENGAYPVGGGGGGSVGYLTDCVYGGRLELNGSVAQGLAGFYSQLNEQSIYQ